MKITTELLESLNACQSGINLVATYPDKDHEAVIRRLVADDHWGWANWLLPRLMDYKGYVSYAVYAAELVLPIWEKRYPNNDRPRKTIEAAKRCIADPSKKNKDAARAAAEVADIALVVDAAWAVDTAWAAADAADAAWTVRKASDAAWEAADAACAAARAEVRADFDIKSKIIEKGLEILRQKNN